MRRLADYLPNRDSANIGGDSTSVNELAGSARPLGPIIGLMWVASPVGRMDGPRSGSNPGTVN